MGFDKTTTKEGKDSETRVVISLDTRLVVVEIEKGLRTGNSVSYRDC